MSNETECGQQVRSNDQLGVTPEELREACTLCAELVRLRQNECKHLCIENTAQEMLHGILSAIVLTKQGKVRLPMGGAYGSWSFANNTT